MAKKRRTGKIGRNSPCPCGSGKKHKHCCLGKDTSSKLERRVATPREIDMMRKKIAAHRVNERRKIERFGHVRDIVHSDFQGHKLVAVGNRLHFSKNWKTFPDFLVDYVGHVLGTEWGKYELKKPADDQHQIIQWYSGAMRHMSSAGYIEKDGIKSCEADGFTAAYLRLSYDLYIIRNHAQLQEEVIKRLKNKDQFQGARHELFVAATLIRAGFEIEYENESDRTQKHPEFIAKHKKMNELLSVEAKSRHRPGVLGQPGKIEDEAAFKAGVKRLINRALKKDVNRPYAIFIDVNMPPMPGKLFEKPWFREIWDSIYEEGGPTEQNPDGYNMIFFSNHPEHYGLPGVTCPPNEAIWVISTIPEYALHEPKLLDEIVAAAQKYGRWPNSFPPKWDEGVSLPPS